MAATLPDRFGPFLVLDALGAGGMGEVYRARDPRLNRDVAIKILSRAGTDAARRFADEARAASALNHPNILTVYDVGDHGGVPYIVSELIDGTSIRALVARAPLPVRDVLGLAVQMAEGLAAAHRAGIVHRDFKPDNVMVTREGRLKILDFGIALVGADMNAGEMTLTQTATLVGTVPYMSPEQARGAAVDFRTDQFSLGLTLYELLTGRRAFRADCAAQTLTAILEDDPEPIGTLNPRVPAPLRWIVDRCLAKDPRQRYESTLDLARELTTLRDRLPEFATAADIAPVAVFRRRKLAVRFAAAAAAVAALALAAYAGQDSGVRLERYRFTPFATDAGYQSSPAWSPDGKTLAYVAAIDGVLQVFTKSIGSPLRAQVTHARFDCQTPFWSPDGARLYFVSLAGERDGLWSVSSVGGEPDLVLENVTRAAIAPNGKSLALLRGEENDYAGTHTLWFSSPPGSEPVPYDAASFSKRRFFEGQLHFSPDGSKLGLWATSPVLPDSPTQSSPVPEFWIIPTSDGLPRRAAMNYAELPKFAAPFTWLPDSRQIVSALPQPRPGVHLWLMDTERPAARLFTTGAGIENEPAASVEGTRIATTFSQANYDVYRLSLDHAAPEPVLASARNEMDPAWSPIGSQLAYATDRSGVDEIWLRSQNGEFERPLVTPADFSSQTAFLSAPTFSPDGQRIAYYREGSDGNRVWISPVAGGTPVEVVGPRHDTQDLPSWSNDGAWIAFPQDSAGVVGRWSLVKTRVGAKIAPEVLVPDIVPYSPVKWSPDDAWLVYNGRLGLSIVSSDGRSTRVLAEERWMAFAWSQDGQRLFGIRQSDDFRHLTFTSLDVRSGAERVISADFLPMPVAPQPVRGFSRVSATTFLTSIVRVSSDIWLFNGFDASRPWDRMWRWFGVRRQ